MTSAGTPGSQPGQAPAGWEGTVSADAVSTAVGLMTRLGMCPEVPRAAVLAGQPPGEVLAAMEIIATALLKTLCPGDHGATALQILGQFAAAQAAQMTGSPE